MDEERNDEVTRALARIRSRRSFLKAGAGAALGAGLGLAGAAPAGARGKTGIVSVAVPDCAGPATLTATVTVKNPTNGATIVFGLSANRRGGGGFFDTGQRDAITLVAGQTTYQVSFDVSAFQARSPKGQTVYNSLRVDAVGAAGGTFDSSVIHAKSRSIPPCGVTTTTAAPTTTEQPTTVAPTTTTAPPTTAPPTTIGPTTEQPTTIGPPPTTAAP